MYLSLFSILCSYRLTLRTFDCYTINKCTTKYFYIAVKTLHLLFKERIISWCMMNEYELSLPINRRHCLMRVLLPQQHVAMCTKTTRINCTMQMVHIQASSYLFPSSQFDIETNDFTIYNSDPYWNLMSFIYCLLYS